MLKQFLKYQFKSRAYLAPMIFVIFTLYHFFAITTDMSRIGIFFLQGIFYDIIRRSSIPLTLVVTSRFPLRKLLWLHNAGYFIWFNAWYIAAELILIFLTKEPIADAIRNILRFEILLVMATTVGNVISNSDYVRIRSKFWQYTAAAFVFTFCYLITTTTIRIIWNVTHSFMSLIILLMLILFVYRMVLLASDKIRFYKYMIK